MFGDYKETENGKTYFLGLKNKRQIYTVCKKHIVVMKIMYLNGRINGKDLLIGPVDQQIVVV